METSNVETLNCDFDIPLELEVVDDSVSFSPASAIRGSANLYDPRLILDLAFGIDELDEILPRYGLSVAEFDKLSENRNFRRELALTQRDIRENGLTFSRKAQFQAESYLQVLDTIVNDPDTVASTRLEAIRSVVKWGNLEPKDSKEDNNATQVNVQINF